MSGKGGNESGCIGLLLLVAIVIAVALLMLRVELQPWEVSR